MLRNALSESLKKAMRSQDKVAISTLRLVLAALKDRDIAARTGSETPDLGDGKILSMLETMVKQRRESIKMYEMGDRPELAEQERSEIAIIEQFLPKQLNNGEIEPAVAIAIAEVGGRQPQANGQSDGKFAPKLRWPDGFRPGGRAC